MTPDIEDVGLDRSRLARIALAAWVNVDPDKLPAEKQWIEHPNDDNRKAWDRVVSALHHEAATALSAQTSARIEAEGALAQERARPLRSDEIEYLNHMWPRTMRAILSAVTEREAAEARALAAEERAERLKVALEKIGGFKKALTGGSYGSYQRGHDHGFNSAGMIAANLALTALDQEHKEQEGE